MTIGRVRRPVAALTVAFAALTCVAVAAGSYHIVKRIPIAGDTGWDYITADTDGRRLYVPHGIEVIVLDLDTGAAVGRITGLKDAHGVAIARDIGRGFIDATDPGSVTLFDVQTLAVIDKVRVGDDRGTVLRLDARDLKVLDTWPLPGCGQPSSMDMDRVHARVFIGCRSGLLAVVNGANGKIVATQPIGPGVDALEFDPARGLVLVSTGGGAGVPSVFHQDGPDTYSLVENVKAVPGARTMALDHKTGSVYLPVADLGAAPAPTAENPRPRADGPRKPFRARRRAADAGQNFTPMPPLILRPSSGAHASTAHRPSTPRTGRTLARYRCLRSA